MEFKENKAIYLQIADYVTGGILQGKWAPEERIPSVRELAAQLEVNPNTVMRAFEHLQVEGVIFNKRGLGYYVALNAAGRIKSARRQVFIKSELPAVFHTIYLLDISMEELTQKYMEYISENHSGNRPNNFTDENE